MLNFFTFDVYQTKVAPKECIFPKETVQQLLSSKDGGPWKTASDSCHPGERVLMSLDGTRALQIMLKELNLRAVARKHCRQGHATGDKAVSSTKLPLAHPHPTAVSRWNKHGDTARSFRLQTDSVDLILNCIPLLKSSLFRSGAGNPRCFCRSHKHSSKFN